MTKPLRTQFVLVDGGRARWVSRTGEAGDFTTTRELKPHGHHGHGGGHSGTVVESAGGQRHGPGEKSDLGHERQAAFAREVAEELNKEAAKGAFERLTVVAPPRMLGVLRDHLSTAARGKLAGELAKDLTHASDHELKNWLRSYEIG